MKTILRLTLYLLLIVLGVSTLQAQDKPLNNLPTEYVFTIEAGISEALTMGESVDGIRRSIPITGGIVYGENINGKVVPGGADYQIQRGDGSTKIRAVYMIQTDDGALINVINEGLIIPPSPSGNDSLYFRTTPQFTAPTGNYAWLNNTIFVSAIRFSASKPNIVIIDVYKVL
jgi:hypothetical protein